MGTKKFRFILFSIVLLILGYGCIRNYRISTFMWKNCGNVYELGDSYRFDFHWNIFSNKLYQNGKESFILLDYEYFLLNDKIVIRSLDGGKSDVFCGK